MFKSISEGDKVLRHHIAAGYDEVETVTMVTKTLFFTDTLCKVKKTTGRVVGSSNINCGFYYKPATAEALAEITERNVKKNLLDRIHVRLYNYGSGNAYSNEVLGKIIELLDNDLK